MSAESVVQAAVLAALRGVAGLNGVYLGPPVKATVPFAELGDLLGGDWSVKDRMGRELRLLVTVRDAGERPARVQALAEAVGAAIEAVPRNLAGWRVASVVLVRSRLSGAAGGRWNASVEYRVRVLAG
ncbi:DUF3168 domain-containing protein [Sphingomonas sp. TF3]|uniref:tail completion protein gp17 n=1 Tax=Sphingomonas sp. TF3 TaxID=2495580 RepID=UPI000F8744F3|nr:DUF3168 domain-containing protein [Sphingomonas sp. TF3]RUN77540.1 DUF3168 domain-containing protein [Sphingomonas sp. TF3]